ncbi:MAG: nucleotide exchange factor GrpE [Victivallaceae bacterium]|nr:nucleotide exchange factor GrpE [Victivallaceae bacterium]
MKKKKTKKVTKPVDDIKSDIIDNEAGKAEISVEEIEEKELTAEEQVEALTVELAESRDDLLRLKADFQNYRMRTAKEISNARVFGQTDTILPFLQVFDHFSMAMMAAEKSDNMDAIKQGLEMILKEYKKGLDELGVVSYDAEGEKFDPKLHDAMTNEPSDKVEEGYVIKQWNGGYKLGERLLRPATVVVSSGPAKDEQSED